MNHLTSVRPEPVEGLPFFDALREGQGFDTGASHAPRASSPNGSDMAFGTAGETHMRRTWDSSETQVRLTSDVSATHMGRNRDLHGTQVRRLCDLVATFRAKTRNHPQLPQLRRIFRSAPSAALHEQADDPGGRPLNNSTAPARAPDCPWPGRTAVHQPRAAPYWHRPG